MSAPGAAQDAAMGAGDPTPAQAPAGSQRALEALRAHRRPMTARQVGLEIGCGRHDARRLLNRLLEQGRVGWTAEGWLPLPEDQPPAAPPAERKGPPARRDPRQDPRMRRR